MRLREGDDNDKEDDDDLVSHVGMLFGIYLINDYYPIIVYWFGFYLVFLLILFFLNHILFYVLHFYILKKKVLTVQY